MPLSKDELKGLLGDLELNEETLDGLSTLVENHVKGAVEAKEAELNEAHEAELTALREEHGKEVERLMENAEKYGEYIKEEVVSKVTEYTDYAVGEFIKENQEKLNQLELYERMKSAFEGAKSAFEQNGFPLNENAQVEAAQAELNEAKTAFNTLFDELNETREKLQTAEMALIFEDVTRSLADTQKEKVRELSESVTFDNIEEFKTGLSLIVEQVKKPAKPAEGQEQLNENTKAISPSVEAVLKALGGKKA